MTEHPDSAARNPAADTPGIRALAPHRRFAPCLALAVLAGAATGQPADGGSGGPSAPGTGPAPGTRAPGTSQQQPALRRIDPGTADLSPNALSMRYLHPDQRNPTGFEQLYALPDNAPTGEGGAARPSEREFGQTGPTRFARVDGGVVAVFPRSVYLPTRAGNLPVVPPGTVFHIGSLESLMEEDAGDSDGAPPPGRINTRLIHQFDQSLGAGGTGGGEGDAAERRSSSRSPSLWTDESHRRRRIAELLDAARRTERGEDARPR